MSGKVVHFEVPYDDGDRARAFYREVFGWNVMPMPGFDYTGVSTGASGEDGMPSEPGYIGGGMFQRDPTVSTPIIVMAVDDIDATLAEVAANGGSTAREKEAVGEMGFAAYFNDCEGNLMGLWQSAT